MKSGYIYVLTHPSDPSLYKIGITIREPLKRLAEHNNDFTKYAGKIVHDTGQKWQLKEYHEVPDPYWAESTFWRTIQYSVIPYRYGLEVENMSWEEVKIGLEAAKAAGVRPGPKPLPDSVYAYTASMRKRLTGRDITLLGYVKSMVSGKATFKCSNGHEWRAGCRSVAEGEGCPECGMGTRTAEEVRKAIHAGVLFLLTHPDKPGFIKIDKAYGTLEEISRKWPWGDWKDNHYRNIEELDLAEKIIWELLDHPLPHDRQPIKKDLREAEEAFRNLHYVLQEEIAFEERRKEAL